MTKIYAFFLLFALSFNCCFGQKNTDKIRAYYQLINKAELAIVDSNYADAKTDYLKASKFKSLNAKDIFNAFLISYYSRDTFATKNYYSLLVSNGYTKKMFTDARYSTPFYDYISLSFDSLYNIGASSRKGELAEYLNRINSRDQAIRANNAEKDAIKAVDKKNADSLVWFNKKFGYPGFATVGFFDKGGFSAYSFGTFWMVMWHQRPIPIDLLQMMHGELIKGNLNPDDYALAFDNQQQDTYGSIIPQKGYTKAQIAVIDANRSKIYLESFAEFKKKLIFSYRRKEFMFMNVFYKALDQQLKNSNG